MMGGVDVATAAGLALGALADLAFGDPRRAHPVAGFGQAAAALFAQNAEGSSAASLVSARVSIAAWLRDGGSEPWPGLAVLEPARAYPARHGAILLPWEAALAALSKAEAHG